MPSGYQEVEYTQSTGGAVLNAQLQQYNRVVAKVSPMSSDVFISGAYAYWNGGHARSIIFGFFKIDNVLRISFGAGNKDEKSFVSSVMPTLGEIYEFDITANNGNLTAITNGITTTGTFSAGRLNPPTDTYLFKYDPDQGGNSKIYKWTAYNNNTAVRDFIPCINPSNEVGMYDLVTQAFFGQSNSRGSLIAGPYV